MRQWKTLVERITRNTGNAKTPTHHMHEATTPIDSTPWPIDRVTVRQVVSINPAIDIERNLRIRRNMHTLIEGSVRAYGGV